MNFYLLTKWPLKSSPSNNDGGLRVANTRYNQGLIRATCMKPNHS